MVDVEAHHAAAHCRLVIYLTCALSWEQVKSMSPAELKGALQRTFDIRLSSSQLGAMAHLFGTGTSSVETEYYEGGNAVALFNYYLG